MQVLQTYSRTVVQCTHTHTHRNKSNDKTNDKHTKLTLMQLICSHDLIGNSLTECISPPMLYLSHVCACVSRWLLSRVSGWDARRSPRNAARQKGRFECKTMHVFANVHTHTMRTVFSRFRFCLFFQFKFPIRKRNETYSHRLHRVRVQCTLAVIVFNLVWFLRFECELWQRQKCTHVGMQQSCVERTARGARCALMSKWYAKSLRLLLNLILAPSYLRTYSQPTTVHLPVYLCELIVYMYFTTFCCLSHLRTRNAHHTAAPFARVENSQNQIWTILCASRRCFVIIWCRRAIRAVAAAAAAFFAL